MAETPSKPDPHELEDDSSAAPPPEEAAADAAPDDADGGYDLHPEAPEATPPPAKRPETCPNCGAPMTESDALLCLRCGFDLKTLSVVETKTGAVDSEDEPAPDEEPPILSPPGRGGVWLPGAIATLSAALLIVGYLAGAPGLFPAIIAEATADGPAEVVIRFPARLLELLRFVVLSGLLLGCGVAALVGQALLLGGRIGDIRLAVIRVGAIVLAMRLSAFIHLGNRALEWSVEALAHGAIFFGLSMLLLRLRPRDVGTYALMGVMALVGLWLGGELVNWVLDA